MTNNNEWGSKWPITEKAVDNWIAEAGHDHTSWPSKPAAFQADPFAWPEGSAWPQAPVLTGIDLGTGEKTVLTTFEDGEFKHKIIANADIYEGNIDIDTIKKLKSQGSNLVDDQQYLYFQCESCNEILDPHTKSFATLQEYRVNAGWKCIWNLSGQGYKIYCAECGKKV